MYSTFYSHNRNSPGDRTCWTARTLFGPRPPNCTDPCVSDISGDQDFNIVMNKFLFSFLLFLDLEGWVIRVKEKESCLPCWETDRIVTADRSPMRGLSDPYSSAGNPRRFCESFSILAPPSYSENNNRLKSFDYVVSRVFGRSSACKLCSEGGGMKIFAWRGSGSRRKASNTRLHPRKRKIDDGNRCREGEGSKKPQTRGTRRESLEGIQKLSRRGNGNCIVSENTRIQEVGSFVIRD